MSTGWLLSGLVTEVGVGSSQSQTHPSTSPGQASSLKNITWLSGASASRVPSRWPLLNIFLPFQRAIVFSTSHLGHFEEWPGATQRKSRWGPHLLNKGGYKDLRVNAGGQRGLHSSLRTPVRLEMGGVTLSWRTPVWLAGDGRGDF